MPLEDVYNNDVVYRPTRIMATGSMHRLSLFSAQQHAVMLSIARPSLRPSYGWIRHKRLKIGLYKSL